MKTRYDLMDSSVVTDTDNEVFPDPLSLNYREILNSKTFNIPMLQYEIDDAFIEKPYILTYTYYSTYNEKMCSDDKGQVFLDDVILDLNNVKHKDAMKTNDMIYFPDPSQLSSFISTYSKG